MGTFKPALTGAEDVSLGRDFMNDTVSRSIDAMPMMERASMPLTGVTPTNVPGNGGSAPEIDTTGHIPAGAAGINIPGAKDEPEPLHQTAAKGMMAALSQSDGKPGDWAKAAVSGVTSALAGFGAGSTGQGAIEGIGAAARQRQEFAEHKQEKQQENSFKQQQLDLEKERMKNEQQNQTKEFQLKDAENARQQAESVARLAEHDKRLVQMDDEHKQSNFQAMREDITFRQQEIDREDALKQMGAKPLSIGGKESPAFDDLGAMEKFATDNHADVIASHDGNRTRGVLGADGKYRIYEVPDSGPQWFKYKDATGKQQKAFTTPEGLLAMQDKVADIKYKTAQASKDYAQASKEWAEHKDSETAKNARAELTKVGGDYTKLSPGAKEALTGDAQKRYSLAYDKFLAGTKEMQKDPAFSALPTNAQGQVDVNSSDYKALRDSYHIDEAQQDVADSYDELRQLGHGYKKPGASPAPASQPQEQLTDAQKQFQAEQQKAADDKKKEQEDAIKQHNEREAEPESTTESRGRQGVVKVNNPNFNEAEAFIAKNKNLTGPQRAEIRQQYAKSQQGQQAQPQIQKPQAGAPQKGDTKTYNGSNYVFDGSQYVKQPQ